MFKKINLNNKSMKGNKKWQQVLQPLLLLVLMLSMSNVLHAEDVYLVANKNEVVKGEQVVLTSSSSFTPESITWYYKVGRERVLEGYTSAEITVTPEDNTIYSVVYSKSNGDSYTSNSVEVKVKVPSDIVINVNKTEVGLKEQVTLSAKTETGVDLTTIWWQKKSGSSAFSNINDATNAPIYGAVLKDIPETGKTYYRAVFMKDGVETYSNEISVYSEYKCATNSAHVIFTDDFGQFTTVTDRTSSSFVGSDYSYVGDCKPLKAEGTYAILANPKYAGNNEIGDNDNSCNVDSNSRLWFRDLYDHTQGGIKDGKYGGMLAVNADKQMVYSRNVTLDCTNTNLIFSAWFAAASKGDPISVRFFVKDSKGNEITEATLVVDGIDFNSKWVKGETSFYTGEEKSFTVEIHSYNAASDKGNDFLIDDISFSVCSPDVRIDASSSVPEVSIDAAKNTISGSCGSDIKLELQESMVKAIFENPYYLWYVKALGDETFKHKPEYNNSTILDIQITPYTQYYVVATASEADANEYLAGTLSKCTPVAKSNEITVLCTPNLEVEVVDRNCNVVSLEATKYDDPSDLVDFWWEISSDGRDWTKLDYPRNTTKIDYPITTPVYFRINTEYTASKPTRQQLLNNISLVATPNKTYVGKEVEIVASANYEVGEGKYQWFEKDLTDAASEYKLLEETVASSISYTLKSDSSSVKVIAEGCEAEIKIEKLEPLKIVQKSRDCNEITIEGITDIEPSKIKWSYSVDGKAYTEYDMLGTPVVFNIPEEILDSVYVKGTTTDGIDSEPIVVYPIVIKNSVYNALNVELTSETGFSVNNEENVTIKTEISGIEFTAEDKIDYKSCQNAVLQSSNATQFITSVTEENKCFVAEFKGCISENIELSVKPKELIWPTAFNPLNQDGINDTFVKGYGIKVSIYDRYGNFVVDSEDGWDGSIRGGNAMPGVYFYVATLPDGTIKKGTIELVHYVK